MLEAVQARRDRILRAKLLADPGVLRALERLEERLSGFGYLERRRLLTGAVRLSRSMAPAIADVLAECRGRLGVERPVELYVQHDARPNAFCVNRKGASAIVVALSSRLVETFAPAELAFVIGHELGHVVFDHLSLPMPHVAVVEDLGGRMVSRASALELYVWCRAAELSADRAGLVCARDPEAAGSAFFKLSSGLGGGPVRIDLEAYQAQVLSLASAPEARPPDAQPVDGDATLDCFATHPFSPLRVRAMAAFARSEAYARLSGRGAGELSDEQVETLVEGELAIMEPSYLEETTAHSRLLRRLLYSAGLVVAAASGGISTVERDALRALLGSDETMTIDVERAKAELPGRIAEARKEIDLARRAQLVQHVTIIAAADGIVDEPELDEMHRLAAALGVDGRVVEETLAGSASPLD
jgi:Zn-dependent protease with chaperone function/uncharacterized tellurite resistance protein B-like protein